MATTAVAVLAAAVAVTRLSLSIHSVAPTFRKRPAIFEIPVWLGWLVWLSNPYGNYGNGSFGSGGGSYATQLSHPLRGTHVSETACNLRDSRLAGLASVAQ